MPKRFSAQVKDIVANHKARAIAVVQTTLQDVVEEANRPVAKGGKMRVDTGFLRNSGKASLSGMPSGPVRGDEGETYNYDENVIITTIGRLKIGTTFYFGWTANYARARETYDGFLETTLQNFQEYVKKNAAEAERRIK